ncbi:unnamed protein product [Cuscuta campestris]|uniref:Uncharacterized protein n=1 Tax=Cuscuta campestris TaxID=132261 RepID=A0A484MWH8_9ASTE|nr:unnamed protein product [Cuscuta campestris]
MHMNYFGEGSWYEPPYSRDYTLFAEEQIEANKVAIRERAKLLESVRKEKEFERRLCEGSDMMQKMLDDFQRERLEAEAKADKLVNDLCKAVELKRSLQSQDQMRKINVQKEALEPKTIPEPINQQVLVLEDSPNSAPSQKPESITTLARATVVMLPESLPSQVPTSIVVHEVEPTEGPDSEPPTLVQGKKEEEVLPTAINDHLLNCVEDTPPKEPVLEEIEPITCPQDSNIQESEEESVDEEILFMENPNSSIETCANNASPVYSDQTLFDYLHDGCNPICPEDSWSQKSWDELLVSDLEDSSIGESTVVIIKPQMDSQPIEDKEEINFTIKANDVDLLRRLPPPPTYTKSPPYILLPPCRREESRILDLDRAKIQTGWHQKRVRRAKLYDSRIGKDMGCLVGFWAVPELQEMLGEGGTNVGRAEVEGQGVGVIPPPKTYPSIPKNSDYFHCQEIGCYAIDENLKPLVEREEEKSNSSRLKEALDNVKAQTQEERELMIMDWPLSSWANPNELGIKTLMKSCPIEWLNLGRELRVEVRRFSVFHIDMSGTPNFVDSLRNEASACLLLPVPTPHQGIEPRAHLILGENTPNGELEKKDVAATRYEFLGYGLTTLNVRVDEKKFQCGAMSQDV